MSYNRIESPGHTPMDEEYNHHNNMPPQPYQTNSRSHTPAGQGFQMQEGPFMGSASNNVPYRPTGTPDRLNPQPTYHVENVPNSYGHNEQYMQHYQQYGQQQPFHDGPARIQSPYHDQQQGHPMQEYALNPEQHHDAYYQQPYEPQHGQGHDWNDANTAYDPNGASYGVHDGYSQGYPTPANEAGQPFYDDADNKPILQADNSFGPNPHQELAEQDQDAQLEQARQTMPKDRPIKRWKTVKEVQLFEGNLVLDCPVPPRLLAQVPHAQPPERDEFTHMRYSAATCDPSTFYEDRFTLRQRLFAKPRHTELFIVVTMYNEDEFLFARTMLGIFKNIEHMCGRSSSKTWGKDAWKKIVVCVVSDGRAKINPRTLAVLAGLGVYQDGIAKQQVNGKDVTAHIYEYTTQVGLEIRGEQVALKPRGATPVQILFCLKEKNQKKINSHRWFFQAFGRVLNPNICVLLDAGTKPGRDSIYHLWKAFDLEPMCGGACGEIKVMLSGGKNLVNPLVATQNFEYKMSNILDKPLESAFGFISVLPGAFSAYRYIALQNDKNGQGPLEKYFAGEKLHGANAGIFTANMYLAEDRILCFELVSKRNCRWILQYVKSSTGETDVPDSIAEFILQRRRWLNGSFFAAVYAVAHFYQIGRSDHSFFRKFALGIEFTYQTINMLFAWFAIGNFFLVFRILTVSLGDSNLLGTVGVVLGTVFEWLYLAVLLSCFVLALGNRPQGSRKFYMSMVLFWVVIMAYLIFASIFITVKSVQVQLQEKTFTFDDLFQNALFRTLIVSLFSTWVLYLLASIIFFDPWHMVTSFLQYLLLTPTYINILNVYAFCNTHDITWGTKGDDKAAPLPSVHKKDDGKVAVDLPTDDSDLNSQYEKELRLFAQKAPKEVRVISASEKQEDYYKGFRSATVLVWILSNLGLAAVVLNTGGLDRVDTTNASQTEAQRSTIYMSVILYSVAGLSLFRFIGACWFLLIRLFRGV